ncbi:MAG: hypothetical protein ACXWMU_07105 [Candidatus Limnocylindrales bacterium]
MRSLVRSIAGSTLIVVLSLAVAGPTLAANPPGTGQPSQSCQAEPAGPAGIFSKANGFARLAVNVYAGSPGTKSLANGNAHAVSQYDVACFQYSQRH